MAVKAFLGTSLGLMERGNLFIFSEKVLVLVCVISESCVELRQADKFRRPYFPRMLHTERIGCFKCLPPVITTCKRMHRNTTGF